MDINGMRESRAYFLPSHVGFFDTNSSKSLVTLLSNDIAEILKSTILKEGHASLAVSGGRTPIPLFVELSKLNLDWSKVELTLADDRWVDSDHEASNERLVRKYLLKNKAIKILRPSQQIYFKIDKISVISFFILATLGIVASSEA